MSGVPYIFANATTSIPLSELDSNFATPVTIGSTSVALGNTVTILTGLSNVGANVIGTTSNVALSIQSNATTAITVDTSQNVGIGTASPACKVDVSGSVRSTNYTTPASGAGVEVLFGAVAGRGDVIVYDRSASAYKDMLLGGNNMFFYAGGSERGRFDTSGDFLVGTTSTINGNTKNSFQYTATNLNGLWVSNLSTSDAGAQFVSTTANTTTSTNGYFYDSGYNFPASFSRAFAVRHDGVIFALNTTVQSLSDQRLKQNIVDATDGLDLIKTLRPVRFDWKPETGILKTNQLGFIAQEVEAVFPDAVDTYDNSSDPSNPYKSVGAGLLIPVLVKAVQELNATITAQAATIATLQSQVAALQAKVGA